MGKINSKQKGKRGELEVVHELRGYGYEARRGQQFSGNPDSPDVVTSFPLHTEVKLVESLNLGKAMEQAMKDANSTDYCVIHRKSREDWNITMKLDTLMKLLGRKKSPAVSLDELDKEQYEF